VSGGGREIVRAPRGSADIRGIAVGIGDFALGGRQKLATTATNDDKEVQPALGC